ncbi:MAG: head-tail adaptor protein [Oscillospiraceae bacterium]|jgi:hypothetical protein|nr:head-tail adaptor protein [Oscillospiraceae bacterium]
MKKIGGNITANILRKVQQEKNIIGEKAVTWVSAFSLLGFLDLQNGDSKNTYNAKLQESTHIFICDYQVLSGITPENSKLVISGQEYQVILIDNPMQLNQHLEIYLKYLGGQNVN